MNLFLLICFTDLFFLKYRICYYGFVSVNLFHEFVFMDLLSKRIDLLLPICFTDLFFCEI